jgi:hypothetical protein
MLSFAGSSGTAEAARLMMPMARRCLQNPTFPRIPTK